MDDAIALGELHQRGHLLVREVAVDFHREADRAEADRRILDDAERAAKVEIALGVEPGVADGKSQAAVNALLIAGC